MPYVLVDGFPDSSVGKESTCKPEDPSSIPGSGRSSGEGIGYLLPYSLAFLVAQLVKNLPTMQETWVRSRVGKIAGEGKGCPLQYSGLENSMDCIVHGISKSQTPLSDFHFHFVLVKTRHFCCIIKLYLFLLNLCRGP